MFIKKVYETTKDYNHNGLIGDYAIALIEGKRLLPALKARKNHGLDSASVQRSAYVKDGKNKIADGVVESGINPIWSIVIALHGELALDENNEFRLPETEEECERLHNCVEVIEGNNRESSIEEIERAIEGNVIVTVQILSNPTEYEVGYHFDVMNTKRVDVDKDLCITNQYKMGQFDTEDKANFKEAYELLVRANSDYDHPLFGKVKIDDKSKGFSIKTLAEYMVNNSVDVIAELKSSRKVSSAAHRYEVIKKYWKVVERENAHDCTGGKGVDANGKTKRMTTQRAAVTIAELANFCNILASNNVRITENALASLYNMWVHEVMGVKHILLADNGKKEYYNVEGKRLMTVSDRWNGRRRAFDAVQADYELLNMAYNRQLMVERV